MLDLDLNVNINLVLFLRGVHRQITYMKLLLMILLTMEAIILSILLVIIQVVFPYGFDTTRND